MAASLISSFGKLFRDDRTETIFASSADESQRHFMQMLESELKQRSIPAAVRAVPAHRDGRCKAEHVQQTMDTLLRLATSGNAQAKAVVDALHAADPWSTLLKLATALAIHDRLVRNGQLRPRLEIHVRAQTVQVVKSRTFRADTVEAAAAVQLDYRLVDGDGTLSSRRTCCCLAATAGTLA